MAEVTPHPGGSGAFVRPRRFGQRSTNASPDPAIPADQEAKLFVQLYSKLATALSVAGTVGDDSTSILSLQIPGLEILGHLDPNDPRTQYYVANALNPTLHCSWEVVRGAATVTDVYKSILDGKEVPIVKLTQEQLLLLRDAQTYLTGSDGQPSPAYREYEHYQLRYLEALDDYEAARATQTNGGPCVPKCLERRLEQACEAWKDEGHRDRVEQAIAVIGQYEALEPELFWKRLAERYREYTRTVDEHNEFQFVTCTPPYEHWFNPDGWSSFTFDSLDFDNQARSGGVGIGAETCCCGGGGPRFPVDDPATRIVPLAPGVGEQFRLTARLRRVEIVRPWMDANVFYGRAWRWSQASVAYGVTVASGGNIAGRVVPTGVMPVLPTTAILGADIEIYLQDGGPLSTAFHAHRQAGLEMRFGPFRITKAEVSGEHHITMPGTYLLGFISEILPKCPNPDPLLHWPVPAPAPWTWLG